MCSANYSARAFGICASMSVREARARCPQLEIISTSPGLFEQLTETSKRVNRILLQVTERIEPLSCDEMQLQLGCDSGEPRTSLSCWLALFVRQFCESMVIQQALALATAELWPGWPRGVRNLQAMACIYATREGTRGAQVVDSAVAEHLRNDFGRPDRAMVRDYSRYRLK